MKRFTLFLALLSALPVHADCVFREDTASQTFLIGPFLDATDGVTAETGLTIANTDIRLSKNGGNMVAKNSGGGTHDEEGMYQITLDDTDTDTAGMLQISVQDAAHVPVFHECLVYATGYYDLLVGTTSVLSALDTGLVEGSTTIATLATQTSFTLTDGATNDDAYNDHPICFIGGTEKDCSEVLDYTGSTKTITLKAAPEFIIATTDTVRIYHPSQIDRLVEIRDDTNEMQADDVPALIATAQADLDILTGSDEGTLATSQPNYAPATAAAVAALNDPSATAIRDAIMQYTLDNSITFEMAACHMMSVLLGEAAFTSGSPDQTVFQDPTGTDTRVTIEYGSDNGDRTSVTLSATNCGSN